MFLMPRLRARRAGLSASRSRRRNGLLHLQGQCLEERINLAIIPIAPPGFTNSTTSFTQSTPATVPGGPAVVTSTLVVSGAGSYLADVNLTTFLSHTFPGDLDVTLTSPAGTVVTLTSDNGGTNDNVFNGTVWDDGAPLVTDAVYAINVLQPTLTPEEAMGAFIGEDPNGTWTITISDDAGVDGGTLTSWSLEVTTIAGAPTSTSNTFSNTTPAPIPDPGTVTSTIVVSGLSPYLLDVNVTTFVTHTFNGDLTITLTSPAGTVVTLTSTNAAGNDNVFNGTVWDDDANPAGQVPYTSNNGLVTDHAYVNLTLASPLVAEGALAAFIGENPNGTWTITVTDNAAIDIGTLNSWSLDIDSPVALDYGDAPSPYPTLLPDDGARHLVTGPQLGPTRDFETDGQPNANATGDDTAGDDEDGVVLFSLLRGQNSSLSVTVQDAPGGAFVDAWIDFNRNGVWEASEQIADSAAVVDGSNSIIFAVPGSAAIGATFARVRLSTAGNLDPTGLAADGEVEDYQVNVASAVLAPPAGFTATSQLYSQTTPVAISGSGTPTVTSTIVVSGAGPYLLDLNLQTFLQHTFPGDLDITLTSPSGTVVTITTDNGVSNDNVFNGTLWDDDADPDGTVPFTTNNGSVTNHAYAVNVLASPLTPEEAFGAFVGENPNGTWTITINDDANIDGGSLNSWDLEITTLNAAPTTVSGTFSNTTPVAISTGAPSVVTSTITVAGAPTYFLDVNMSTFLRHTFSGDLQVTLTSPAGTVVTITSKNGTGHDNIFNGTRWDDDANPAGQVPYGSNNGLVTDHVYVNNTLASPLVPQEALAAFIGENPNGTWTLTIADTANLDGGSLDSWSLEFAFPSAPLVLTPGTSNVVPDPISPSTGLLLVVGTSLNDTITIDPISGNRTQVKLNGKVIGIHNNADFARIQANGLAGNDKITVNAAITKPATLNGDGGNDTLYGGAGNDALNGGDNDDKLFGGKGNDILHGNAGNDSVYGQDGNDTLFGDAGIDKLWGEAGNDALFGGTENDGLYGGAGNDNVFGEAGNDSVFGDGDNDLVDGGEGDDTAYGGAGNDQLVGGIGNDKMLGEAGDDSLQGDDGNDSMNGGAGNDVVNGGIGNDSLLGDAGNDYLFGGEDADYMNGGAGNDSMNGDEGNDTMLGDAGNDFMDGGDDNDSMNGGAGNDVVRGSAGNDTVSGGAGNDVLLGGDDADILNGDNDKDILIGGAGADTLNGGAGDDVLVNGTTDYDGNDVALSYLITEWGSTRTYAVRVANLRNGTGPVLTGSGVSLNPGATTADDGDADTLTGAAGVDWFLAEVVDTLTDRNVATEQLN